MESDIQANIIAQDETEQRQQQPNSTEINMDELKTFSENSKINNARINVLKYLDDRGEVLSDDHVFTRTVNKICQKLKIGDLNKAYRVFCVDTEDNGLAFNHSSAKICALGKSILKKIQRNGVKLCEDHIASILAHELTHEKRHERSMKDEEEQYSSDLINIAGHNQEHEADRQGMQLLAEAGYNPYAMIEMLEGLSNLKNLHTGLSHPNDLDRVNHLKDILFDDNHPISNTDQDYTSISEELKNWLETSSDEVYQHTNEIIFKNAQQLKEKLLKSTSSKEFLITLKTYRNALLSQEAMDLVESGQIDRQFKSFLIFSILNNDVLIGRNGEFKENIKIDGSVHGNWQVSYSYNEENIKPEVVNLAEYREKICLKNKNFESSNKIETIRKTDETNKYNKDESVIISIFLQNEKLLLPITIDKKEEIKEILHNYTIVVENFDEDKILGQIQIWKQNHRQENKLFEDLAEIENYLENRLFLQHLKLIFDGQASFGRYELATLYPECDKQTFLNERLLEQEKKRKDKRPILSAPELTLDNFYNVSDHTEELLEAIKLSYAFNMISPPFNNRLPINNEEIVEKFASLIKNETKIENDPTVISKIYLSGERRPKFNLMDIYSDDDLLSLIKQYNSLRKVSTGRISPQQNSHQQYLATLKENCPDDDFQELQYLSATFITMLLTRRNIKREDDDSNHHGFFVDDYNISFEEWKILADCGESIERFLQAAAIRLIVSNLSQDTPIKKDAWTIATNIDEEQAYWDQPMECIRLTIHELDLLMKKCPWGLEKTLQYLLKPFKYHVENILDLSVQDRNETLSLASTFIKLADKNLRRTNGNVFQKMTNETYINQYIDQLDTLRLSVFMQVYRSELLKIFTPDQKEDEPSLELKQKAFAKALEFSIANNLIKNMQDLFPWTKEGAIQDVQSDIGSSIYDVQKLILTADEQYLNSIAKIANKSQSKQDDFSLSESFTLLATTPSIEESESEKLNGDYVYRTDISNERSLILAGLSNGEVHPKLINKLEKLYEKEQIDQILNSIKPSTSRDRMLSQIYLGKKEKDFDTYFSWLNHLSNQSIDQVSDTSHCKNKYAKTTARFGSLESYNFGKLSFSKEQLVATTQNEFDDLTLRRYPFRTVGFDPNSFSESIATDFDSIAPSTDEFDYSTGIGDYSSRGNMQQRIVAEQLFIIQDQLINPNIPFKLRLELLKKFCPMTTVVRDIHLERMIRQQLSIAPDLNVVTIQNINQLLPMFASNEFTTNYASLIIEAQLRIDPNLISDPDKAVDFITRYIPKASLKRNYYLSLIENTCSINVKQAKTIQQLKLTEELETQEGDQFYNISIFNHLSNEIDRIEKRKQILWLLKLSKNAPESIEAEEKKEDGSLNTLPDLFLKLTPPEREIIFKKYLLGEQGIIDLTQSDLFESEDPLENRKLFIERIGEELIPESTPNAQLFRKIFKTVLEEAQPVRSTQIITILINKFIKAKQDHEDFGAIKALSTALCSLGVIGKKVAQSLAEQKWVPNDFRKELTESQENADQIPKSSLVEIARQDGLLDPNGKVQITKFNSLLGAASNKQAAMVTVMINDPATAAELGIKVGDEVELVGKFKRPSAAKKEVLNHDLKLLSKIMEVLEEEGVAKQLPTDFVKQISNTVAKELKFDEEVAINHQLTKDIQSRSKYLGYTVGLPKIIHATNDIVLETKANGISIRKMLDQQITNSSESKKIKQVILREMMFELLNTGNIHADLHPANAFVDTATKTITLIDLGLNAQILKDQTSSVGKLLIAVLAGDPRKAQGALQQLGWPEANQDINFINWKNATQTSYTEIVKHNLLALVNAATKSKNSPPPEVSTLIFAVSKLESWVDGLSPREAMNLLGEEIIYAIKMRKS